MHGGVREDENMDLDLICPICGKQGYKLRLRDPIIKCDNCATQTGSICFVEGELITQDLLDKTAIYLFYHPLQEGYRCFLGSNDAYEEYKNNMSYIIHVLPEQVEAWYPRTFAQKIDCILLYVAERAEYYGQPLTFCGTQLAKILFANISQEDSMKLDNVTYVLRFLEKEDYIEKNGAVPYVADCLSKYYHTITLAPKALARVDELQKTLKDTKQVFIAMSFDKSLDKANKAIQKAISDNGYIPRRMDEYAHNNQIVPEMLYQIRQSKFIIADLTGGNNGAYYEAGYANGLGIPIILTCREDSFKKGTHFDVKQQATVIWENEDDLKNKLTTWIEATIGKAN